MRLFVAGYPPAEALDDLAEQIGRLRLGQVAAAGVNVRVTARPLWHVTLAFLGEVAADRGPAAASAVRAGVARWREAGHPAPALRLAGGGRFGGRRFAVLWAGLAGDLTELHALAEAVRRELRRARLPFDRKPFRPHLTFARPGDRLPAADLAADAATQAEYEGPEWTMAAVHLVRSYPGPKPVHEPFAAVPLAGGEEGAAR